MPDVRDVVFTGEGESLLQADADAAHGIQRPNVGDRIFDGRDALLGYDGAMTSSGREVFLALVVP